MLSGMTYLSNLTLLKEEKMKYIVYINHHITYVQVYLINF